MENTQTTKLRFNKFGLIDDPRGGHCTYVYEGRELLGEVKDVIREERYTTRLLLDVRFMNGEAWPIQPCAASVNMLVRTYEVRA